MPPQSPPNLCFICLKIVPSNTRKTAPRDTNYSPEVTQQLVAAFLDCFSQSVSENSADFSSTLTDTEKSPKTCNLCGKWLEEWCQVSSQISTLKCRLGRLKACLTCAILDRKTVKCEPTNEAEGEGLDKLNQLVESVRKSLKNEFNVQVQIEQLDESSIPAKRTRGNETEEDSDSEIIIRETSADLDSGWVYDIAPASPEPSDSEILAKPAKRGRGRPRKPKPEPVKSDQPRPRKVVKNKFTSDAQWISPNRLLYMKKFVVDVVDGDKFMCATCGRQYRKREKMYEHIRDYHIKGSEKSGTVRTDALNLAVPPSVLNNKNEVNQSSVCDAANPSVCHSESIERIEAEDCTENSSARNQNVKVEKGSIESEAQESTNVPLTRRRTSRKIFPEFLTTQDGTDQVDVGGDNDGDWAPESDAESDAQSDGDDDDDDDGSCHGDGDGAISVNKDQTLTFQRYIPETDDFIQDLEPVDNTTDGSNHTKFTYLGKYHVTRKSSNGWFYCEICRKSRVTALGMVHHIHFKHYKKIPPVRKSSALKFVELEPGKYSYMGKFTFRKEEENKFICDVCGYPRISLESMGRHMEKYHVGAELPKGKIYSAESAVEAPTDTETVEQSQNPAIVVISESPASVATSSEIMEANSSTAATVVTTSESVEANQNSKPVPPNPPARSKPATTGNARRKPSGPTKRSGNHWKKMTPSGPNEFIYDGQFRCQRLGEGEIKCIDCGQVFSSTHSILNHIEALHLRKPYKAEFKSERLSDGRYKCLTCDRIYGNRKCLRVHIDQSHLGKKPIYKRKKGWKGVKVFHKKKEIVPGVVFEYRGYRYRYDETEKRFFCLHCTRSSVQRRVLNKHINHDHIDRPAERYICDMCGEEKQTLDGLRNHKRRHHQEKLECPQCGKFYGRDNLRGHMKIHQGEEAKKLVCEFCGKRFYKQNQLAKHRVSHTGAADPYSCEHCDEGFKYLMELREHVRQEHPETLGILGSYLGSSEEVQDAVNSLVMGESVEKITDNSAVSAIAEAAQASSKDVEAVDEDQLVDFKLIAV